MCLQGFTASQDQREIQTQVSVPLRPVSPPPSNASVSIGLCLFKAGDALCMHHDCFNGLTVVEWQ